MKYILIFLFITCSVTIHAQTRFQIVKVDTKNSCNGQANGAITITSVTGGISPFMYSIDGDSSYQSSNIFNNLVPNIYPLRAKDSQNRVSNIYWDTLIQVNSRLIDSCSGGNLRCNEDTSGFINVIAAGGEEPYQFTWSNGSQSATQTGLPAGTYTATATDRLQCTATCSITITEPGKLIATARGINLSCTNTTGTVWVDTSGGTPPYQYLWNIGSEVQTQSGLPAGTYSVKLTDANGCSDTSSVTLIQQGSSVPKYHVGDTTQCGYIFYVDNKPDSAHPCATHYLICAFEDQNQNVAWYNNTYITTNATTDILFDRANSYLIDSVSFASQACTRYASPDSSCTGWYLPSKTELDTMYANLAAKGKGNFAKEGYWSSVESSKRHSAWIVDFLNGRDIQNDKANKYHVRAVCEVWLSND